MAKPKFPFKPGWWINNRKIRTLSDKARSALVDMMIYMMDGDPYGSFVIDGLTYNLPALAKALGRTVKDTEAIVDELILADIISIDEAGIICSNYMAHQYEVSEKRSTAGAKGGNPSLAAKKEDTEESYLTKKKRKLKGAQLTGFNMFWDDFNDKHRGGKAEAADSWLDLKVNKTLFEDIIKGARREAERRSILEEKGRVPIMAQGWLSGKRWEV